MAVLKVTLDTFTSGEMPLPNNTAYFYLIAFQNALLDIG